MNDGSLDYKNYHLVDSLAFGTCEYPYRNLGRPSKLQFKQTTNVFEVMVDDKLCFTTDKVRNATSRTVIDRRAEGNKQVKLPKDYYFGITAASADTPDSFEINKFLLFTDPASPIQQQQHEQPHQHQQQQQPLGGQAQGNRPQDVPATQYTSSESQFGDIHDRLQSLSHLQESSSSEISRLRAGSVDRQQETLRSLRAVTDKLNDLEQKLNGIERSLQLFESKFAYMQNTMRDTHSNLVESLPRHMTDGWCFLSTCIVSVSARASNQVELLTLCSPHDERSSHGSPDCGVRHRTSRHGRCVPAVQTSDQAGPKEIPMNSRPP